MTSLDIVAALAPVTEVFGQLKIAYSIGGSVASSVHGRARATMDIDIVAALPPHCVNDLVDALPEYHRARLQVEPSLPLTPEVAVSYPL